MFQAAILFTITQIPGVEPSYLDIIGTCPREP